MSEASRESRYQRYLPEGVAPEVPEEAVDRYIELMESSYGVMLGNAQVEEIMTEEASAYFSGQRAPEDIIPVMENRVQTVLDENG